MYIVTASAFNDLFSPILYCNDAKMCCVVTTISPCSQCGPRYPVAQRQVYASPSPGTQNPPLRHGVGGTQEDPIVITKL